MVGNFGDDASRTASGAATTAGSAYGLTILVCGPPKAGKSFLASGALATSYGAVVRSMDPVVYEATLACGMVSDAQSPEKRRQGRRRARHHQWPDEAAKMAFFESYRGKVADAFEEAHAQKAALVFEGRSLRHADEAALILEHARATHGPGARVVRLKMAISYDRWLRNQVLRAAAEGTAVIPTESLTPEAFASQLRKSEPEPVAGVEDFALGGVEELGALTPAIFPRDAAQTGGLGARLLPPASAALSVLTGLTGRLGELRRQPVGR